MKDNFLILILIMLINASGFKTLTVNSTCSQRLGIESGVIKDFQLTATSSLSTFLGPEKVALDYFRSTLLQHITVSDLLLVLCEYIFICKVMPNLALFCRLPTKYLYGKPSKKKVKSVDF